MDARIIIAGMAIVTALVGSVVLFALGAQEGGVAILATTAAPIAYLFGLHDDPPANQQQDAPDDTPPTT